MSTTRIGFIGLGVMGAPMAIRLATAGHPITVNTRTRRRAEPVLEQGAVWGDSAQQVAAAADVVITMLPDTADVERVGHEILDAATSGTYWIDMSTIASTAWRGLVDAAAQRGIHAVDAPVSGGEQGARDGTLSIMVGADDGHFEVVQPVLALLGTPMLLGAPGAGQVTKACNQVLTAGTLGLVAEALTMARASGVDPRGVREALLGGFAASRILEKHGLRMLDGDYQPGFSARLHRKDIAIALHHAAEVGMPAPFTAVSAQLLDAVVEHGDGALDSLVVHRDYLELAELIGNPPTVH